MLSTSLSSVLFLASYAYASQKPLKIGGCLKRSSGPIVFNPTCDWHEEPGIELNKVLEIESSTFPLPAIEWPWSFAPYCVESGNVSDPICLYTSLTFARGRGISLITTPSEAKAIAQLEAFTNPSALADVNIERNPPYESRALPGRGIGLIANKTLYRGDHIFSHTPVLAVNDRLHQSTTPTDREFIQNGAVARLPEATRQKFLALHGHFGGDPISDIINTNSFDVEFSLAKQDHYIVLPETSRMNHDCRPNAHYFIDPDTLTHHVHALRTINPGEEITISYIDPAMSREERLKKLKVSWGFDCNCSRCTQPRIFTDASDARLKLIAEITEKLADKTQNRTGSIDDAKLLISLYEQERLDAPIAEAYTYAALEENYVGNTVKAKKWAAMALEMNLLYGGPKDPDFGYMQQLFDDPKAHWSWMYTVNWKVNDPKNAQVKDEKKDPESLAAAAADSVAALKAMFGSVYA